MGNNTSRATSWAEPLPKPKGKLCGARQAFWPYKECNRPYQHIGNHCCTAQCGDKVVETWWEERDAPRST
jgi:hypothetical protein